MGRGIFWIILGFFIGFMGAITPVFGIPAIFVGVLMMMYGIFRFWFGAGAAVVKGAAKATGTASKKGTGRL